MLLTLSIFPLLRAQSVRLKAQIAEWDSSLVLRYGDRYNDIKQQFAGAKDWYQQTKSAAQTSGTIPLDRKQTEADERFAEAGAVAARKEAVIKQQLKDLLQNIKKR
jgi:hypothetical protein